MADKIKKYDDGKSKKITRIEGKINKAKALLPDTNVTNKQEKLNTYSTFNKGAAKIERLSNKLKNIKSKEQTPSNAIQMRKEMTIRKKGGSISAFDKYKSKKK